MKRKTRTSSTRLIRKREAWLKKLAEVGPMVRGSLVTAQRGNHLAHQLTVSVKSKTHTVYVPMDMVEEVKEWINGDINNLDKLIKTEKLTEDIKIWILQESGLKSTFNPNPITSGWTYKDSKIRIKLDVYFETWQYLGDGTIWKYKHYVNVKSQKRNWRGKWKYNTTDMFIKGKWDGRIDYEDPEYLYTRWKYFSATYHPSYYPSYYHIIASDFYSSISILYGIIGPYPTTWNILYTVNGERVRILNISIYHLNWEAIGHGDAKATIP